MRRSRILSGTLRLSQTRLGTTKKATDAATSIGARFCRPVQMWVRLMDEGTPGLAAAVDRLEALSDELVARQMDALKHLGSYRRVPDDELRRSCRRNVVRVVTTLRGGDSLPPDVIEDERASGRRRAAQGIPAEDVVAGYRAVMGVLRDSFLHEAAEIEVPNATVLQGIRRLWDVTDHYSSELVSARHQFDLDLVRGEERHRQNFLHNLLTGRLSDKDVIEAGGAALGLGNTSENFVLRGRSCSPDVATVDLLPAIDRATRTREMPPLLGLFAGDLVGVTRRSPESLAMPALIGIEGPVQPDGIYSAFLRVSKLLDIGIRFGLRGVLTAKRLSLRAAIAHDEALGQQLHERYIMPLDPHAAITPLILQSVQTYLDCQRSIPMAARELNIHVNTLRYRLQRFQDMTSCDLSGTQTILEVWWALQFARIHASPSSESS